MALRKLSLAALIGLSFTAIPTVSASAADADDAALLKRGKIMFLRCRSCHTLNEGGRHLTGPNLHGLVGAKAADKDYAYSDALKNAGVIWDEASLDKWIASPSGFVKGNRMVFGGLKRESDRKALIAYLKKETQ